MRCFSSRYLHALLGLLVLGTGLSAAQTDDVQLFAPTSDGRLPEISTDASTEVPHPTEFLGYTLGERFTHHHRILDYFQALDRASDRVSAESYGTTYQGRPLELFIFTHPEHQGRLDQLRRGQLRLANPESLAREALADLADHQPAIVWLAYGVHGNESSSPEAAMATGYALASGGDDVLGWLKDTIVIIDPAVNPDGRERFVHSYVSRRGRQPDPAMDSMEHREPWPGGRFNHYHFDLNRDWTWASQTETRQRLVAYQRWEPHVYVDLHEMSPESSYFFPPAAEPINANIDPRILDWLEVFGRQNAAAFDAQGWLYYVREVFDLFYPGYGDSYPGLRGAVGMTYEVAGGGRSGQELQLPDGRYLRLSDRIVRHFTTSLATIRTAARNRSKLVQDFVDGRRQRQTPPWSYLWPADQPEAYRLAQLLQLHGLEVGTLERPLDIKVKQLAASSAAEGHRFEAGTFVASTVQPLGRLLQTLMEPEQEGISAAMIERQRQRVEARQPLEFFDITAWSLPLAFNLEAWRAEQDIESREGLPPSPGSIVGQGRVGFLIAPQGLASYRAAARMLQEKIQMRLATNPMIHDDETWPSGTLFVPAVGNPENLEARLAAIATEVAVTIHRAATSYSDRGSLGSESVLPVRSSRIGLIGGAGVDPRSFGFAWHLMDQEIELEFSRLELDSLDRLDLEHFDVLIFPQGRYDHMLADDRAGKELKRWLERGGQLIAIGPQTYESLRAKDWTSVVAWKPEEATSDLPPDLPGATPPSPLDQLDLETPGAILATEFPTAHPLTLGLHAPPPALFIGSKVLLPTGNPSQDVFAVRDFDPVLGGFAWPEAEDRLQGSLLVSSESIGQGRLVVIAQEPIYRMFWRGTAPIFLNAVLFGKTLP